MPAIRLRLKADTHAEARGASGSVATEGGVERAPDTCLQLLLVCPGERPICQPNLTRSPVSTAVDVLGPALREHTPGEEYSEHHTNNEVDWGQFVGAGAYNRGSHRAIGFGRGTDSSRCASVEQGRCASVVL